MNESQDVNTPLLATETIIYMGEEREQQQQEPKIQSSSKLVNGIYWILCIILWAFAMAVNFIGGYIVEKVYY